MPRLGMIRHRLVSFAPRDHTLPAFKLLQKPNSPFNAEFDNRIFYQLDSPVKSANLHIQKFEVEEMNKLLKWLCSTPKITTYRVNTLVCTTEEATCLIMDQLQKLSAQRSLKVPKVYTHPICNEVIVIESFEIDKEKYLQPKTNEVIVDEKCGAAVLRGAHLFGPGVLGMTTGSEVNSEVSIYVDLKKECNRGFQKVYDPSKKLFVGNGIIKFPRNKLFREGLDVTGMAVEVMMTTSGCPQLKGKTFLEKGVAMLQNLPSVVCIHVLDPKPGEIILDMCASPGNKTTHIGAIMKNQGTLIAIDVTPKKVATLIETIENLKVKAKAFVADSTIIYDKDIKPNTKDLLEGPPFAKESFDKILLDAPCSGLGQRPQLLNRSGARVIFSHVPRQKKLFKNAINLVKVDGTIVYSTCSLTLAENENIVSWVLKSFDCVELIDTEPRLGSYGSPTEGLNEEQLRCLQRFGPDSDIDSVGFFIAKFKKVKPCETHLDL